MTLRLGTRGSALALVQARTVEARLQAAGATVEIVVITTSGDRLQQAPLSDVGGKQLFVKEIDDALAGGAIDLAVHSAKDMPAELPEGIDVAAVLPREDPRDALIVRGGTTFATFEEALRAAGARPAIGTGSVRRIAQLRASVPQAAFAPVRGNVDTRLRKLDQGDFDALVLAMAGLRRLGLASRISAPIPIDHCIPAPGQGIVAIEARSDDRATRDVLASINDPSAMVALTAERAVVSALGGGCRLPLGALAEETGDTIRLRGVVASPDGARAVYRTADGLREDAAGVGRRLAHELASAGASEILDAVRSARE